ncbi:unnamed protein product, partial [Closterium sp. NIES-54]
STVTAAPATAATATATATAATAAPTYCTAIASLRVLAFDHEGRPIQFDTWLDDLQLYLLSDSKDSVSLFDLASGAATAPPATADSLTRSQWLTRDAAACLAIRNHLPLAECAHFGQHRTAQVLYDAVVARYSSPATAALGRHLLPYLFPEQSAFATVEDLVSHLPASNARYRAAVPAEDHFLSLDPNSLTVDLLEQHLFAAETSAVALGAARGTPRPPFFEGCSPSPLAPSYASAAAADVSVPEDVGAASASVKRRSSKGKGGRGGGGGSGGGGGGSGSGGGGSSGGGGGDGTVGGSGGSGGGGGGTGGSGVARSSTILLCPTIPAGSLSGLHLPSFSTNLVSTAALQDAMVTTTTPGGQRVSICTCTRTGRHLATFNRRPGSSLYTLTIEPSQVAASAQVSASGQGAASCSCRLLSHQNLLWHHRLGHPSLPRLRGMHSRLLRAAPHSSSFFSTTAPLQSLHMDVWGPARIGGQSRERYFVLVVDDYTRYTTVFPLRIKGHVVDVLIPWIRTIRLELRERFVMERAFSSRSRFWTAERRIGLVMEVAHTSMIHAAAPHFLWLFIVQYAAHQLNLWPRVSLPETLPTLRWTGEVGDASVFRVWESRAFVRNTSADKLSARAIPCVFLGFVPDAPGWQFYHPTSRRVFPVGCTSL